MREIKSLENIEDIDKQKISDKKVIEIHDEGKNHINLEVDKDK